MDGTRREKGKEPGKRQFNEKKESLTSRALISKGGRVESKRNSNIDSVQWVVVAVVVEGFSLNESVTGEESFIVAPQ